MYPEREPFRYENRNEFDPTAAQNRNATGTDHRKNLAMARVFRIVPNRSESTKRNRYGCSGVSLDTGTPERSGTHPPPHPDSRRTP